METERIQILLRRINLRSHGLEEALKLRREGDPAGALSVCAGILRDRLAALPRTIFPASPEVLERAELLLQNRLSLLDTAPQFLGEPIDWLYFPDGDQQWQSHLGYLYWANSLLSAHASTGEEKYLDKWKSIQAEFLANHPYGTDDLFYSTRLPVWENEYLPVYGGEGFCPEYIGGSWIALAAASRVEVWLAGMQYLAGRDRLDDGTLWALTESLMTDHLHVLLDAPRRGTPNQYVSCASALLKLGVFFWEFPEAGAAYLVGMDRLESAVRMCVLPDGTDPEQSINYNFGLPARLASLRDSCGLADHVRMRELMRLGEKRCLYLALAAGPGGHYPDLAKTHAREDARPELEKLISSYPEADGARSVLSALSGGQTDAPLWSDFPYGGYSVQRTGWGGKDAYLFFKYSRYSPGHKHEDANSLVLSALGRQLLVDTGNFNYSGDPSLASLHAYFFGSAGHNTLDPDGLSQRRLGREAEFKVDERWPERADNLKELEKVRSVLALGETPCPGIRYHSARFDVVQGLYSDGWQQRWNEGKLVGPILEGSHRRTVIFLRPDAWVVLDDVSFSDALSHDVAVRWHFGPDFRPEEVRTGENSLVTCAEAANLGIWSFGLSAPHIYRWYGSDEPFRGWYVPEYGEKVPAVDAEMVFPAKGSASVLSLLVPFADRAVPQVRRENGIVTADLPRGRLELRMERGVLRLSYGGSELTVSDQAEERGIPA